MQQYADGRMQTRSLKDAATQKLSVDPRRENREQKSTDTRSEIALLSKYMYSCEVGSIEERRLQIFEGEVKVTLGSSEWSVRTLCGI